MTALKRAFVDVPMIWRAGVDLVVGQRGNVAWVADRPQVLFDDGSDFAPRITIVFVDEGGPGRSPTATTRRPPTEDRQRAADRASTVFEVAVSAAAIRAIVSAVEDRSELVLANAWARLGPTL